MRTAIVFYSRTGHTRSMAERLAGLLDGDLVEIRCPRYRTGWFRYLLAGYDSVKGNLPAIDFPEMELADYDLVLIGAPVWTSYPALPVRTFLSRQPVLPDRVAAFFSYGGHSPPEKAVATVNALLARPVESSLAVKEGDAGSEDAEKAVKAFADALEAA